MSSAHSLTRDEGIAALDKRTDRARLRFLELLVEGKLVCVSIEDTSRPNWRVTGRTWGEALRNLDSGAK